MISLTLNICLLTRANNKYVFAILSKEGDQFSSMKTNFLSLSLCFSLSLPEAAGIIEESCATIYLYLGNPFLTLTAQ